MQPLPFPAQQHGPNKLCLVDLPYLHALFGQRYFVHDIVKLVHEENVIIDKNCDVVDDIVDNIGICGGVEQREKSTEQLFTNPSKAAIKRRLWPEYYY